jgi:hypothetical protein
MQPEEEIGKQEEYKNHSKMWFQPAVTLASTFKHLRERVIKALKSPSYNPL